VHTGHDVLLIVTLVPYQEQAVHWCVLEVPELIVGVARLGLLFLLVLQLLLLYGRRRLLGLGRGDGRSATLVGSGLVERGGKCSSLVVVGGSCREGVSGGGADDDQNANECLKRNHGE